ncbi:MAG TPA: NAD(P)-dependent oxidoreductase [Candidatus Sulfotelmatobacter sp.]|jgi:dTDP-4-dehydrorhamnose reductase|nr:NAD(P)-dependent oxidoreductase [Candidatus Sulfotelmatobacter sp.]
MKIAITGANGFIGTRLVSLLSKEYQIVPIGYEEGIDIVDKHAVENAIGQTDAETILHLAAYTNVDEAEKQKSLGKKSPAWQINVLGAMHVAQSAKQYNKKLIHVSTDMVFGGIEQEWYHESDTPSPVNFYGLTKYEGELKVQEADPEATILRIAYPYMWLSEKRDFARLFLQFFKEKKTFSSVSDCFYAPTYVDDIAIVLQAILEKKLPGIIHGASGEKWSGYEIALKIADTFKFDKSLVSPTTRDTFFKDRAPRSKNTALYNDTLMSLGIKLHTLEEALTEIPDESLTTSS